MNIYINDYNCISPLGMDMASNWNALMQNRTGIHLHDFSEHLQNIPAAIIADEQLALSAADDGCPSSFTRLEQMLFLALKPLTVRNPVSPKSLLILSTTKGNISALHNQIALPEAAYLHTITKKIAAYFGFSTEPMIVSNACVSGIMALGIAKDMIQSGKYKDAFVIAGDEVSPFIVSGFHSFQAISNDSCKPYDKNRKGINLGEAAAAAYVSTEISGDKVFKICGSSAINDANHISGPSRTGEGLFRSVVNTLKESGLTSRDIDFISAHGTATIYNDDMESVAFNRLDMQSVPLHSLKAFYGHCLGAAGLLEAIIAMESAGKNTLIPSRNFCEPGTTAPLNIIQTVQQSNIGHILKTASGFGGCNAAIILKKM